jgi:hypothetical protein
MKQAASRGVVQRPGYLFVGEAWELRATFQRL